VWGQVEINLQDDGTLDAGAFLGSEEADGQTTLETFLDQTFSTSVQFDTDYVMSIEQTADGRFILTFNGEPFTYQETGPMYPLSEQPYQGLNARIYAGGSGGTLLVEWDDVYVVKINEDDRTIFVTSEVLGTVPLDGTWAFGCDNEEPGFENDEDEVLVFLGDTFEAQEIIYESTDETCTGVAEITILDTGTVAAFDQFMVSGWIDEEGIVSQVAPERNDGGGNLTYNPYVVPLEFHIPGVEIIERSFVYVDDTAEPWCLYFEYSEEDDDEWGEYLGFSEPRCKQ
jgi:hypothetical protein